MGKTNMIYRKNKAHVSNMKIPGGKYPARHQIRWKHLLRKMKEGVAGGTDVKVDIFDQQIET